jgi:hypothetical protein
MKVSKAIEYLSHLDPNEEIIIDWWDRHFNMIWDNDDNEIEVPVDVWEFVVKQVGEREYYTDMLNEVITEQTYKQYIRTEPTAKVVVQ